MASHLFNNAKSRLMKADLDLDEAGDDMRAILCMTNTTADTQNDGIVNTSGITTLDEMDGANYARVALANQVVNLDDANDRAEWDADDMVFAALGNGTRQVQGVLIHEFVTSDAASFPFVWVEFASTVNPGGSTFTVAWNSEGIVQLT